MAKDIENDIIGRKINCFCNSNKDIKATKQEISAWDLVNILKEYYQELYDMFDENSEFYQELLDEVNTLISPEYVSVLKKKNSSFKFSQIRLLVRDGLAKIIDQNYKLRGIKCDNIKIAIRENLSAIKLDIHENYELKPIIICRDIEANQLHLAKNSCNNERLLEHMRGKIANIFDDIDSYRGTIPRPSNDNDITLESFNDDESGNKYEVDFEDDTFRCQVEVFSNGKVRYFLFIKLDDAEHELSHTINVEDIMMKIPINIEGLKDPVKSIVIASFEKEYNIMSDRVKVM